MSSLTPIQKQVTKVLGKNRPSQKRNKKGFLRWENTIKGLMEAFCKDDPKIIEKSFSDEFQERCYGKYEKKKQKHRSKKIKTEGKKKIIPVKTVSLPIEKKVPILLPE